MKALHSRVILLTLLSCAYVSGSSSGYRGSINIDDEEIVQEALYSEDILFGLEALSGQRGTTSGNPLSFNDPEPAEDKPNCKRKTCEVIDLISGANDSDEELAKEDAEMKEDGGIENLKEAQKVAAQMDEDPVDEGDMDIHTLAGVLGALSEDKLVAKLTALGDSVKDSLKDHCNWNLLHEAVYIDSIPAARVLLRNFKFDPNAFDPYFGTAMYLIQSKPMADLLKQYRGNLLDQRPCQMYESALQSSRVRHKLAVVSMIENFPKRYNDMVGALRAAQGHGNDLKFDTKRDKMFDYAKAVISRRRAGYAKSDIFIKFTGEEGIDAGGLTREFITMISRKVLENKLVVERGEDGRYSLLKDRKEGEARSATDEVQYENELKLFGFVLGLSVYHKVPLRIEFHPLIYYILCGFDPRRNITSWLEILKDTDKIYYNSLIYVADLPANERDSYNFPEIKGDLNRSWKRRRTEIKTAEDVKAYLEVSSKEYVYFRYENSYRILKAGYELAVHPKIISGYITPDEMKKSMLGLNDYKAAEWKSACKPPTHSPKYNEVYKWFWEIVDEISPEQRVELLKFVTSLNYLPVGGFKSLEPAPSVFIIDDKDRVDYYPKSSTCFNQIRLYPASSKQKLKEIIISAAKNGSEGFGDR